PLNCKLNAIGGPQLEALLSLPGLPVFVVDRSDAASGNFNQIHTCNDAMAVAGKRNRPGVNHFISYCTGFWEHRWITIDSLMLNCALHRISTFTENSFHPFVEKQPWAVDEFVHHSSR